MKTSDALLFDAVIDRDGRIRIPDGARAALAQHAGDRVRVRLVPSALAGELRARGVTEEEIEAIAARQMEERDQVIRFLRAEGSVPVKRRARRAGGRR